MTTPMTMAEKVMAKAAGRDAVRPGEFITARPDLMMCHEAFGLCVLRMFEADVDKIDDPSRVVVILDHYFPAPTVRMANAHKQIRDLAKGFGIENFLGHAGICHQVLTERGYVSPGTLIFGTDSHTTTYGALGAAGVGIGVTEMTFALATGELWMQVPPTIKFELVGEAAPGLMTKDILLHIAGVYGADVAQYRSIEFTGPAAARMSLSGRMAMANMGVELGAKFAFFEADAKTLSYLEGRARGPAETFGADAGAAYEAEHVIDITALSPQVAAPHTPANARAVETYPSVRVNQAYLGSCTNGRLEDLAIAAEVLKGRQVHPDVRMIVTPASKVEALQAMKHGYIEILMEAGAYVTPSGCGACPGGHGGVVGAGEVCISSTPRNFKGRMGSPDGEIYLASPATVAASAIAGEIVDPRVYWSGSTVFEPAGEGA